MKIKALAISFFVLLATLQAQFSDPAILFNELSLSAIQVADLDEDGDLDYVGRKDGNLVWLPNLGAGRHNINPTLLFEDAGAQYQLIDFNNDDHLDILLASNQFHILPGLGDGTFEAPIAVPPIASFNTITAFAYSDVNDDAIPDLLAAYNSLDEVYYIPVDGDGLFGDPVLLKEVENVSHHFVDVNNDGYQDLVASNFEGFGWYLGGPASFSETLSTDVPLDEFFSATLAFEDLDGDGDTDIAFIGGATRSLRWMENLDNLGSYAAPAPVLTDAPLFSSGELVLQDINGDDEVDFLIKESIGSRIHWIKGLGSGAFEQMLRTISTGVDMNDLILADIDGDTYTDIIGRPIGFFPGSASEEFGDRVSYDVPFEFGGRVFALEDMDGDGIEDIIYDNLWLKSDGNAGLSLGGELFARNCCGSIKKMFDSDQDGDLDILLAGEQEGIFVVENLGIGNGFAAPVQLTSQLFEDEVDVLDVDNDGDLDIFSIRFFSWLHLYENEGGEFTLQVLTSQLDGNYRDLTIVDVDDDQDDDIVAFDENDNRFAVFRNNSGTINTSPSFITPDLGFNVASGLLFHDLDGDDKQDLFVQISNAGDYGVHWLPNNGAWQFGTPELLVEGFIGFFDLIDIDGDLDADILVDGLDIPGEDHGRSRAYLNVEGDFSNFVDLAPGNAIGVSGLVFGNVTQGGLPDIVYYESDFEDSVNWLDNFWNSSRIVGNVYWDENENGQQDAGENGLPNQTLQVLPASLTSWSNTEGEYTFAVAPGEYDISWQSTYPWTLTTDSIVAVDITEEDQAVSFGLTYQTEFLFNTSVAVSSSATRCGFEVPFWVTVTNLGAEQAETELRFVIDDLTEFSGADLPPMIDSDTLIWELDDFAPGSTEVIRFTLQMPGVDFIGEILEFSATVLQKAPDSGVVVSTSSEYYVSELRCAYDPNDKLVEPSIPNFDNYTLFGDTLTYTIRFQNVGNDTAINIRIEDILDENLQLATLRPIASSHAYRLEVDSLRRLNCYFDDIYLPPAITDEPRSHGFIQFEIQVEDMLDEMTAITNQAGIYFDFNPPIITNETENIMVSEFPVAAAITEPTCQGLADGIIDLDFDSEIFQYFWNGEAGTSTYTAAAGSYELRILAPSGEQVFADEYQVGEPDALTVQADITPEINMSGDGMIVLAVSGGTGVYTYSWAFDPANTTNTLSGLTAGTYEVTVTDENDCSTSIIVEVDRLVNTAELSLEQQVIVSPNPARDFISIAFTENVSFDQLQLFSADGKLQRAYINGQTDFNHLDTSNFAGGVYVLVFVKDGQAIGRKKLTLVK